MRDLLWMGVPLAVISGFIVGANVSDAVAMMVGMTLLAGTALYALHLSWRLF